jgi:hypothetical protein
VVAAADGDQRPGVAPLKDRLFIGFHEKGAVIEVISYNDAAGRFEFQVVRDYRRRQDAAGVLCTAQPVPGLPPECRADLRPAAVGRNAGQSGHRQSGCGTAAGLLSGQAERHRHRLFHRQRHRPRQPVLGLANPVAATAAATAPPATAAACRPLPPRSTTPAVAAARADLAPAALEAGWKTRWPRGLAIPNPDLPNRDPLAALQDPGNDPLLLRAPLETWQAPDKTAFVVGLAGMLDPIAVQRLPRGDLSLELERLRARGGLAARPFSHAVLDDLLAELGKPTRARPPSLPPARMEPTVRYDRSQRARRPLPHPLRRLSRHHAAASPQLSAWQSGRVEARLDHCAPRILVRLSMAGIPSPARRKPPMPPAAALASRGVDPIHWAASPELALLKRLVASRLRGQDPAACCGSPMRSCLPACRRPATRAHAP